jgi:DNA-binding NarL/FixJ family response regulator
MFKREKRKKGMGQRMDVRILVVDHHPTVRESLRFVFAAAGFERLMEAAEWGDALDALRNSRVDVVLIDVQICEQNGLDGLRKIRDVAPAAAVLVHTYCDDPRLLAQSFHGGAAGFVVKGEDKNALLRAVRHAAARDSVWTAEQIERIRQWDAESVA